MGGATGLYTQSTCGGDLSSSTSHRKEHRQHRGSEAPYGIAKVLPSSGAVEGQPPRALLKISVLVTENAKQHHQTSEPPLPARVLPANVEPLLLLLDGFNKGVRGLSKNVPTSSFPFLEGKPPPGSQRSKRVGYTALAYESEPPEPKETHPAARRTCTTQTYVRSTTHR